MNAPLPNEQKLQRFEHQFQKASGSREMVEDEDGEWVRYEDVRLMFYDLFLRLGSVSHVLGNHCDPDAGNEMLEPIIEQLQELSA
jgi:hypothetical protein